MAYGLQKIGVAFTLVALMFVFSACSNKQVPVDQKEVGEVRKEAYEREEAARREARAREAAIREEELAELRKAAKEAKEEEVEVDPTDIIVYFAFDNYSLSDEAMEKLAQISLWMSTHTETKIHIEGHCCEMGTNEYNLALGEMRSLSAKKYLIALGVDESKISTISYGEERPLDPGHYEEARAKNRRDQFVINYR